MSEAHVQLKWRWAPGQIHELPVFEGSREPTPGAWVNMGAKGRPPRWWARALWWWVDWFLADNSPLNPYRGWGRVTEVGEGYVIIET